MFGGIYMMDTTENREKQSERIKLGIPVLIAWAVLLAVFFGLAGIRYAKYREIQDAGLTCAAIASREYEFSDSSERAEVIRDLYYDLTMTSYLGYNVSDLSRALRDALEAAVEAMGYDDLEYIPYYFKYINFYQFFEEDFVLALYPEMLVIYAVAVLLLAFTLIYLKHRNRKLAIEENYVVCQKKKGKSEQVLFKDISGVETTGFRGLKLKSSGSKFSILFIKNGAELQKAIMDKKISLS